MDLCSLFLGPDSNMENDKLGFFILSQGISVQTEESHGNFGLR